MIVSLSIILFITCTFFAFKNVSIPSCSSRVIDVNVCSGPDFWVILRSKVHAEAMAPPTLRQVSGMERSLCRYMHVPREDGLVDIG